MIGSAPLRREGGIDIGVGDMPVARGVEVEDLHLPARAKHRRRACLLIHRNDFAPRAVDPPGLAIVARKADAVAVPEIDSLGREQLHLAGAPLPKAPVATAPIFVPQRTGAPGWLTRLHTLGFTPPPARSQQRRAGNQRSLT